MPTAVVLETIKGGLGGASAVVDDVSAWLTEAGHLVLRLTMFESGGGALFFHGKRLPVVTSTERIGIFRIIRIIRQYHVELVHCHLESFWPAAIASYLCRIPCIRTLHGSLKRPGVLSPRSYARTWIAARWLGQHLVAVNDSIREEVERFVGPCPLTVIPNGCRVDPPEQLQEGRAGLAFAFIGRLDKDKGFGTVLKAFTELAKMFSDVSLFVVGDGPMRQAAEAVATSNPKVKLSDGWVARSEVHRWLAGVDAVVLPSKSEGAPIAALEALTLGLPVIISEAGNKSNLIKDSINGYVLPGDGADASALLETLLECVAHPEILYAMRHNASQVAMARNAIAREQYVALVNSLTPVSRRPRSNYAAKT